MNARKINCCLLALVALGGTMAFGATPKTPAGPAESASTSHMESRTADKTRDPGIFGDYWWANRFLSRHQLVEQQRGKTVDLVLLGDSIMHFWEWNHPESWKKLTQGRTVLNLGYGGDRTQQVIWRIQHGELDGYAAKNIVLMIGTNNNSSDTTNPENVAKAIEKIVALVREKQPGAKILLSPIVPRFVREDDPGDMNAKNEKTNAIIKQYCDGKKIIWFDWRPGLYKDGQLDKDLWYDREHPAEGGYRVWAKALLPHVTALKF